MSVAEESGAGSALQPPLAVVLAAGGGTRMGSPKALLPFAGVPLALAVAHRYAEAGVHPTLLVTSDAVREALAHDALAAGALAGVEWVAGAAPAAPMMESVRRGLQRAVALRARAVFVQPVDAGPPAPAVLDRLMRALDPAVAAKPSYLGRGGHPVLLTAAACAAVLATSAASLRAALLGLGPCGLARVEVDDPSVLANWNVRSDLPPAGERA